jgi:hypothetical protein
MNAEWADEHPGSVVTAGVERSWRTLIFDSVLRVFPMDNYQKDEAVGGQSGTDFSELDWSSV